MDKQRILHGYKQHERKKEKIKKMEELLMTIIYLAIGLGIVFAGIGAVALGVLFITGVLK